jgi:hypothetical protein
MKKYKLWFSTLCLALALAFVNLQPVRVYADDPGDPQGTSQKKSSSSSSSELSPEVIWMILTMLRLF